MARIASAKRQPSFHLSGVLLIDKPEGPSSAQVVGNVKSILGAKKVGHLGTLDPFASGLLPLGINEATKIADIFLAAQKGYSGVIALGMETDTQDATGQVLKRGQVPVLDEAKLQALQGAFTGNLLQTPPMFSALKQSGVRLYELARRGENVSRTPRKIQVDRLQLIKLGPTELSFEILCSKGTYVRTLAADMGTFLGCGAHLKTLRRLSTGPFTIEQAIPLDAIAGLKESGEIPLISLSRALGYLPQICLDSDSLSRLRMGQQAVLMHLDSPKGEETMARVVGSEDHLAALVEWSEHDHWRLVRVFWS